MRNVGISIMIALVLALLVIGAILLYEQRAQRQSPAVGKEELAVLRDDLTKALADLRDRIARLEAAGEELGPPPRALPPPAAGTTEREEEETPAGSSPDFHSPAFREYIFSLIEEERELAEQRRREQIEQRRREREEFSKGPYGQFNLKVNSLAKVLGLDQGQKDRYHELTKGYWDELQEIRRNTDWRSTEGRNQYRETQERIVKDYAQGVEELLTPEQRETYNQLPAWTRNLQSLGQVMRPGEEADRFPQTRDYMEGTRPSALSRGQGPAGPEEE